MIGLPLPELLQTIKEKSGLSETEINSRIDEKLKQLSDLISREGAAHIVANELGVKFTEVTRKLQIRDLKPGMRNVEALGKVSRVFDLRQFKKGDREGSVASFIMADGSGSIRVTLWNEQAGEIRKIKPNDVVKIKSAYVKENNSFKEIHLNNDSRLVINPEGETVSNTKIRKQLKDLQENEQNVEIMGTIVQVSDIKFFEICPRCFKRARPKEGEFFCDTHQAVEPKLSYILNVFVDDGTGNMRTVCYKNQAEKLMQMSEQDVLSIRSEPQKMEAVKKELLGKTVKLVGRVQKNAIFDSIEFVPQLVFTEINVDEEMKALEEEISLTS